MMKDSVARRREFEKIMEARRCVFAASGNVDVAA
jgi:hypothetical protein